MISRTDCFRCSTPESALPVDLSIPVMRPLQLLAFDLRGIARITERMVALVIDPAAIEFSPQTGNIHGPLPPPDPRDQGERTKAQRCPLQCAPAPPLPPAGAAACVGKFPRSVLIGFPLPAISSRRSPESRSCQRARTAGYLLRSESCRSQEVRSVLDSATSGS